MDASERHPYLGDVLPTRLLRAWNPKLFSKLLLHPNRVYRQTNLLMEPTVTTPTAPVAAANRPVMAHTTLQPLPKHSVLIAVLIAAVLPALLLALAITVMVSANYNFLSWME